LVLLKIDHEKNEKRKIPNEVKVTVNSNFLFSNFVLMTMANSIRLKIIISNPYSTFTSADILMKINVIGYNRTSI